MKYANVVMAALCLGLTCSCVSTSQSNQTDWVNPNPEIERLHVQAYNLDLGNGVQQDRKKANELYLQAARAGDPRSMMNYAVNLAGGEGVQADLVEAFAWADAARFMTQNCTDMQMKWRIRGLYDELKRSLTPDQLKEGTRQAQVKLKEIRGE